jgi:predicted flap endonuclease-1-like 5' DNA nuclease
MPERVAEIEGVNTRDAKKLESAGVRTTDDLLKSAGPASGRKSLADTTGIAPTVILEWVNRADLMRIKGVGTEFSDLLEASGVDSTKELAQRAPENLQAKMVEINESKKLVRRVPALSEVEKWIGQSKALRPMVTH